MKAFVNRKERLKAESQWHTSPQYHWLRKFINNRFCYSPKRHEFAYDLIQMRLLEILRRLNVSKELILISPCGGGQDFEMIKSLDFFAKRQIVGIDISREALTLLQTRFCGVPMICGDILTMPFKDETFDLIICDLFLHHVVDEGFDKYITEFKRLLRRGGLLLIQEPSILFPLTWVTLLLRRLFYFVTGQEVMGHVHHERPFVPLSLVKTLEQAGFSEINVEASSFVHNRFPLFLGKITALMQKYLFRVPILKYFAWNVIYVGKK